MQLMVDAQNDAAGRSFQAKASASNSFEHDTDEDRGVATLYEVGALHLFARCREFPPTDEHEFQ